MTRLIADLKQVVCKGDRRWQNRRWLNQCFSLVIFHSVSVMLAKFAVRRPNSFPALICRANVEEVPVHRDKVSAFIGGHKTSGQPRGVPFLWWEVHCEASANQSLVLCSELPNPRQRQGRQGGEKVPELEIVILEERDWPTLLLIIKQNQCSFQFSLGLFCQKKTKSHPFEGKNPRNHCAWFGVCFVDPLETKGCWINTKASEVVIEETSTQCSLYRAFPC